MQVHKRAERTDTLGFAVMARVAIVFIKMNIFGDWLIFKKTTDVSELLLSQLANNRVVRVSRSVSWVADQEYLMSSGS